MLFTRIVVSETFFTRKHTIGTVVLKMSFHQLSRYFNTLASNTLNYFKWTHFLVTLLLLDRKWLASTSISALKQTVGTFVLHMLLVVFVSNFLVGAILVDTLKCGSFKHGLLHRVNSRNGL